MNDNKPNFLDRGTLLAFALILLFWFGWSKFMESKAPTPVVQDQSTPPVANVGSAASPVPSSSVQVPTAPAPSIAPGPATEEKFFDFDSENLAFRLSSRGMGLSNINVKKFKTRANEPVILGAVKSNYPFSTSLLDSPQAIDFAIEKTDPNTFIGRANVNGLQIEKTLRVNAANYAVESEIAVVGQMEAFRGFVTEVSEPLVTVESGGFLSSTPEHQDWFLLHEGTKTRKVINAKEATQIGEKNVSIAALSAHYFTLALADRSDVMPSFESSTPAGSSIAIGRLKYQPISRADAFKVKYVAYAGPKSYDLLGNVDEKLPQIVDFGMFGVLGKPILWLLKFLHSLMNNWGWSIVVLTIIVRLIVLPFNAYSYKSMKAMQRIQPEMNRIKEKYKDKPAEAKLQMNQEIMQLMKANNASPVGGCLPTLLQLPVFFALYQVLGQSIELYRAPFIFWIHDLSARDPMYVLPVLMGVTMFVQQKLTPTAMDPQQAKILQWMPVIFSFFMLTLPSGLTLYIFVSTLFGIVQQYFFMRDKSTVQGRVKEAKA